ncbi:zinc finger CCHC domain-containing protein 13-like [Acyrthosiphon pisum]|uniref:CCHC-type domain-containing protein n=1 Tax=Acyrthosiphon pisum TaxID=7029 RepID=A0A8R2H5F8_ACYPI|nr:zinc finger CCHC domain-containing protein 13-like [Acyrthosiphon pisum]|eukprot:XP_016656167.1 PREDICTED: zinc finger CCHC domain-containing protein 13-like [Acyrthosiphon pisum]
MSPPGATQRKQLNESSQDYCFSHVKQAWRLRWEGGPAWGPGGSRSAGHRRNRHRLGGPGGASRRDSRSGRSGSQIDRDVVSDVRIWGTRSGQQIATAKMPRSIAASIARVPIGWTMCRVRPRTLLPERCFRCQAFGHNSRSCTAEDRTGACWKCGVAGHLMKDCAEGDDRCVACETAGLPKVSHKPGSGACAARRKSGAAKSTDD